MIVGVPREVKPEENRVALTPSGVGAFVAHGHTVLVERAAGEGSSLPDRLYADAGARIVDATAVWNEAALVLKVKEPQPEEHPLLRPDVMLFTYLHLAAAPDLVRVLRDRRVRALAYETLQLDDGSLPLLAPMSEVAGRLAVQVGAWCLQAQNGGRGVLISGASGVRPANVVILGAGIVSWLVASLLYDAPIRMEPAVTQLMLTLVLYPCLAWLLIRVQRAFLANA